jgi:O-succinylbenzoate synthase
MVEVTAQQTEGNASDSDSEFESDRQVTFAELEAWLQSQQSDAGGVVAKWAANRRTDQFFPKGALGLQLCKDRIKTTLSGVTSYSKAGYCGQLCRVVTTSRDQLTTHENELACVSLHQPIACVLIVC